MNAQRDAAVPDSTGFKQADRFAPEWHKYMAKIAIIKTGGKQYKVEKSQVLKIEKLNVDANKKVIFDTLLVASSDGKEINLGKPSIGKKVEGLVLEHGKGKKVSVIKYKNKTRYLRNKGHRQPFTKVKIINLLYCK